jgi:predicted GNAT family acetyltransferase
VAIRVERPSTVGEYLALAGDYLTAREAEHNLMLAICGTLTNNPEIYPLPPVFAVALDGARVVAAAMQTPPHNLVLAEVDDPAAVAAICDAVAAEPLPGVLGPPAAAEAFARRWAASLGRTTLKAMAERIYRCTAVIPPRPAPGVARLAAEPDRQLLTDWLGAFTREAGLSGFEPPAVMAGRWLTRIGGRTMWLWDVDGKVVSLTGVSGPTPHGIRVGPVYTPPSERRRGYAGNLVAAATQAQLESGRDFVFLYTDLANPTSNHVYQAIGYEPVADVDYWRFEPDSLP